jgi:hypothetical protein
LHDAVTCIVGSLICAEEEIKLLKDGMNFAWGVIANASGGNWDEQTPEWKKAAELWRDKDFHPMLVYKYGELVMKRLSWLLGLFLVIPMASCSVVKGWAEDAAKETAVQYFNEHAPEEARSAADTDESGVVDWEELLAWITGGGAVTFGLGWLLRRLKRKVGELWGTIVPMREAMIAEGKLPPSG